MILTAALRLSDCHILLARPKVYDPDKLKNKRYDGQESNVVLVFTLQVINIDRCCGRRTVHRVTMNHSGVTSYTVQNDGLILSR
jgi:hypothetical protein